MNLSPDDTAVDMLDQVRQKQQTQVQSDVHQASGGGDGQVHQAGYVSDQSQQVRSDLVGQAQVVGQRQGATGSTAARVMDDGLEERERQQQEQPTTPVSSGQPERGPVGMWPAESVPVMEFKEHEISPEVAEYVEKVEKEDAVLDKPVVHEGTPVVQPPMSTQDPEVVLPMTKSSFVQGMEAKPGLSIRWLAEWCLRLVKKFAGRAVYKPENSGQGEV